MSALPSVAWKTIVPEPPLKAGSGQQQLDAGSAQLAAGQAQLDAARAQAVAAGADTAALDAQQQQLDAQRAQLDEQQAQLTAGLTTLDQESAKLEKGAELLGYTDGIRVVSDDGATAIANVQFTVPRLELPQEAKDAVIAHFTETPIDGVEVAISTDIAQGIP